MAKWTAKTRKTGQNGQPLIKRRPGGQIGNTNRFVHGFYTSKLKRAKRVRLRGKARQMAEDTLACVLRDQGGPDSLSTTFQFVCSRFSRRVARLHVMERAIDLILQKNPQAKTAPNVLAKLNGYLQPLEDACLRDAQVIGFKVANDVTDVAPWEREQATDPPNPPANGKANHE